MCTQVTKHNTQNKTRQATLPPAGTNNSTGFFKTSAGIGTLPNLCCDMLGKQASQTSNDSGSNKMKTEYHYLEVV